MPIPDMKPEIAVAGIIVTYRPNPEQTKQDLKNPGQESDAEGHGQSLLRRLSRGSETDDHRR